jgi:hypothetical protein
MALDARLVEDRCDVLGEGRGAVGGFRRRRRGYSRDEETHNERETHGTLQS